MSEIVKGAFETSRSNLGTMLNWSQAPFDDKYDQSYLNLAEDKLRTISNAGEAVMSYCTYRGDYVQEIELHESSEEDGMEAIVKVPELEDYLSFVGGEWVRVEFIGNEEDRLASKIRIIGEMTVEVYLPSSKKDIESKQLGIVHLYDSRDQFVPSSTFDMGEESADEGEPLETTIETSVEEMSKIVEVADFDDIALSNYPLVVEDGEFVLEAEDVNKRNSVSGKLHGEVSGADVSNTYSRGFDELFGTIDGEIRMMTQDDFPLSVVYTGESADFICRYTILPVS